MTTNDTRSTEPKRPLRRKNRRRAPWNGMELLLFAVSLLVAVSLTGSGLAPIIHAVNVAKRNAEDAKNNHQEYVTFFRDVVNHLSPEERQQQNKGLTVDIDQFASASGFAGQLYAMREESASVQTILTYYEKAVCSVKGRKTTVGEAFPDEAIPERLLELAVENHETIDFVADYPSKHKNGTASPMKNPSTTKVPLYIQWDECWGYESYGDGLMAFTGCAPTCLSMAAVSLTGDSSITPDVVASYADGAGYYNVGSGSTWTLISEGCSEFGLVAEELHVEEGILSQVLAEGKLIICAMGPGDFARKGHYILLTGYEDGMFTVNDPNSLLRSAEKWSYQQLSGQIKNLWAVSKK